MAGDFKKTLKKIWKFIWEDDSVWSWLVNVVLAFVLIKFIVYPGLGFFLQTTHPVVAVVSESMEHSASPDFRNRMVLCGKEFDAKKRIGYDDYWEMCGDWYEQIGITKEQFSRFRFKNGFNKGDIMVLKGANPAEIKAGSVIVFRSTKPDPIIHRVVRKWQDNGGDYFFHTKGDHNKASIKDSTMDETSINESHVIGKAVLRIPLLGYIKIWFNELICFNPIKHGLSNFFAMSC